MENSGIDFVVPWVDGSDPEWRARKNQFLGTSSTDDRENRYRDWDLMRYWFRGVEKFTPWVRKIWFICDQEPPAWLNREHPKLEIIRHEDFMPKEYLPAYSSHPIELNMHRIEGLSEYFVYFNDDTFLIAPMREDDFFKHGLPRDCALISPLLATELKRNGREAHIMPVYLYDIEYLNCDYDFHACVKKHPMKWFHPCYGKHLLRNALLLPWPRFIGFVEEHLPIAYLKSSFEKAWIQDYDILDSTSRHHLRDDHDVNQWLIRHQQLAEGRFVPRKPRLDCYFAIQEDSAIMHSTIRAQSKPMMCLNDNFFGTEEEFKQLKNLLTEDFYTILKSKSSYERD